MTKGIAPLFTTAPRVKLKINGINIAYAIGMNVNVSVNIQPVNIIGKFGPVALEPTLYNVVTGTMQIIRLVSTESMVNQKAAAAAINVNNSFNETVTTTEKDVNGNELPSVTETLPVSATEGFAGDSNNPLSQTELHRHMSPKTVLLSRTFDIDLYMRIPNSGTAQIQSIMGDGTGTDNLSDLSDAEMYNEVPWLRIEKVRLSSRNTNIALGQLVNEPVSFQGLLATPVAGTTADDATQLFDLDAGQTEQP